MEQFDEIKKLIADGMIDRALDICNAEAANETNKQKLETIYYLMGNAHRKREEWKEAMNCYQKAIDLNPDSPAVTARKMIVEILEYFYKDQFNQ